MLAQTTPRRTHNEHNQTTFNVNIVFFFHFFVFFCDSACFHWRRRWDHISTVSTQTGSQTRIPGRARISFTTRLTERAGSQKEGPPDRMWTGSLLGRFCVCFWGSGLAYPSPRGRIYMRHRTLMQTAALCSHFFGLFLVKLQVLNCFKIWEREKKNAPVVVSFRIESKSSDKRVVIIGMRWEVAASTIRWEEEHENWRIEVRNVVNYSDAISTLVCSPFVFGENLGGKNSSEPNMNPESSIVDCLHAFGTRQLTGTWCSVFFFLSVYFTLRWKLCRTCFGRTIIYHVLWWALDNLNRCYKTPTYHKN